MSGDRCSISLPGFSHANPIPVASRLGSALRSGVLTGRDPDSGQMPAELDAQVANVFTHLKELLRAAGARSDDVARLTVWLLDFQDRAALNREWEALFPDPAARPARQVIAAKELGGGALIHVGLEAELPDAQRELFALVKGERLARDTQDWDGLSGSYWSGARVRVTWFDGSIEDFVEASRASVKPGKVAGFHTIDPVRAEVEGDRALVESRGQILLRPPVEGVECDLTAWCRFVAGAERRDGRWRLAWFDNIYVKDRVDPTTPGERVEADPELLAAARVSYRWLTYTNLRRGMPVPDDLPGDDRPDLVARFWDEARGWLRGSPGPLA